MTQRPPVIRAGSLSVASVVAGAGMFVFPAIVSWNEQTKKLDKKPAITGWREAATTDPAQLLKWWDAFLDAVPGIELGRSGLFVVDLDRHPGGPDGVAAFKALRRDNPIPRCLTVKTPSDGFHLYFRQPHGDRLATAAAACPQESTFAAMADGSSRLTLFTNNGGGRFSVVAPRRRRLIGLSLPSAASRNANRPTCGNGNRAAMAG